ncbi:unnamed protein product [Moneuplotes crassus]|uniref:t-SNARE coiled-coil homology domain-containing protein n=1 Tax=Euplotes crassus TaxID=5936 RepID=A0AAD1XKN7_EUPCR|nr:unnamed protein product [Moneuplotes crassus]
MQYNRENSRSGKNLNSSIFKGVVRDRTKKFFSFKISGKYQSDRFKTHQSELFKDFHEKYSDNCDDQDDSLLRSDGSFNPSDPYGIQRKEKHALPPRWVDQEEEIEEYIIEINEALLKFEKECNKIKRHEYMVKEDVPIQAIDRLNSEIINLIRKSENTLSEIKSIPLDDHVDRKVKDNVHYSLAIKLKGCTSKANKIQKELVAYMESHYKKDDDTNKPGNLLDGFDDDEEMNQQEVMQRQMAAVKDEEIEDMVKAANDLASLFKELSVLVIEQGTVLDRIDYNVETALVHTKKGRKHLVKAKEYSESSRARNIILCLAASILFCIVILIIKKY